MNFYQVLEDFQKSIVADESIVHPYAYLTGYYSSMIERIYEIGNEEVRKHIEMVLVKQFIKT